jgi:hypothetical protein
MRGTRIDPPAAVNNGSQSFVDAPVGIGRLLLMLCDDTCHHILA